MTEYKGYTITTAPGLMYAAHPPNNTYKTKESVIHACTEKQLKIMVDQVCRRRTPKKKESLNFSGGY